MIINGKRALAYIVVIDSITAIEGADNIELAHIGGWNVVVKKGEFQPGDLGVFFEIDSKLPERDWSEFLRPKHFKIKTMKLGKFGVISQGLVLPATLVLDCHVVSGCEPVECNKYIVLHDEKSSVLHINSDVTELLGVTYSVEEDNKRKANSNPNGEYDRMARRHPHLAKQRWFRFLMKYKLRL